MNDALLFAFSLSLVAGLATAIGGITPFFVKPEGKGFLSGSLGFSAGVMLYVSFVEVLPDARSVLIQVHGPHAGPWLTAAGFFIGILLILVIDFLVPSYENPHEVLNGNCDGSGVGPGLHKLSVLTTLALTIHNFPEGVATLFSGLHDPVMGLSVATAIGLHNILEGTCVALPVYLATKSRRKAFLYSLVSGLAEPLGGIMAYLVLRPFLTQGLLAMVSAAVAGIMVFISVDQLLPNAKKLCTGHQSVYGLISGMAVVAIALLLI